MKCGLGIRFKYRNYRELFHSGDDDYKQ